MRFELPLVEERVKPHQLTALHLFVAFILLITASLLLVSYSAVSHLPEDKLAEYKMLLYFGPAVSVALYAITAILLIVTIVKNKWLQKPMNNMLFRTFELLLIASLFIYCTVAGLVIPAIIYAILCTTIILAISWERKKHIPLVINIDKDGIKLPITSRTRIIDWADIEHVILRFGTLTVNCVDNRLYQWNIGNYNFETDVFEVFCIRQVDKAKEKRDNNNW
jgi:hypothetical protein